jgi:hypothetical protein
LVVIDGRERCAGFVVGPGMLGMVDPAGFEVGLLFCGKKDGNDEAEFTWTSGNANDVSLE